MPALILLIGILLGGFALYRFMLNATIKEVIALILTIGALILGSAMFFLAVTGRLPVALGVLAALTPLVLTWLQARKKPKVTINENTADTSRTPTMTRAQALDILGLQKDANTDDIINAHRTLMKQHHPDQEGSEELAKKINQAKDFLIKN